MTEIILIILAAVIVLLYLLFKFGIIKRRVIVTIVENLPIGIFRDKNKSYEVENKVYIKELKKDENEEKLELTDQEESMKDNRAEGGGNSEENKYIDKNSNEIVYWTPKGKTFHSSKSCLALSRSKVIIEGTVDESGKVALCDLCRDYL